VKQIMKVDPSNIKFLGPDTSNFAATDRNRTISGDSQNSGTMDPLAAQQAQDQNLSPGGECKDSRQEAPPSATNASREDAVNAEILRLRALQSYHVLDDRTADPKLVRLATVAARTFRARVARLVVVDLDRCWCVASSCAFDKDAAPREMPRKRNLYANHYQTDKVIPNLQEQPGMTDTSYLSSKPGETMKFYASTPLVNADGLVLGTLAVLDTEPRAGSLDSQCGILQDLAACMMDLMEERRKQLLSGSPPVASFQPALLRSTRFLLEQLQSIAQDSELMSMTRHYQMQGLQSSLYATKFLELAILERKRETSENQRHGTGVL